MKNIIQNLLLFDKLTEQQIRLISGMIKEVHLRDGEYFTEPGDICLRLAFVDKGVLRYNHYNRQAENITSGFIGEGNFVPAAALSHLAAVRSDYLQAITECALSVIDQNGLKELSSTISNWDHMVTKISRKAVAEMRSRILHPFGDKEPELAASEYLATFPDLARHLSVGRMLLYIDGHYKKVTSK